MDLDALEGPEADGVIRVSNADYLSRPLRWTATEATAVMVALLALRNGAQPSESVLKLFRVTGTLARFERLKAGEAEETLLAEAEQASKVRNVTRRTGAGPSTAAPTKLSKKRRAAAAKQAAGAAE